jgi:hypothetical protein
MTIMPPDAIIEPMASAFHISIGYRVAPPPRNAAAGRTARLDRLERFAFRDAAPIPFTITVGCSHRISTNPTLLTFQPEQTPGGLCCAGSRGCKQSGRAQNAGMWHRFRHCWNGRTVKLPLNALETGNADGISTFASMNAQRGFFTTHKSPAPIRMSDRKKTAAEVIAAQQPYSLACAIASQTRNSRIFSADIEES